MRLLHTYMVLMSSVDAALCDSWKRLASAMKLKHHEGNDYDLDLAVAEMRE